MCWKVDFVIHYRPNDSRMIVALGEAYEKLERLQEAKKCYWKAHSIGDMEGSALIKLGRSRRVSSFSVWQDMSLLLVYDKYEAVVVSNVVNFTAIFRLYERLNEEDQAAAAYTEYINETDMQGVRTHALCSVNKDREW